jgi:2-phospho-L-lactate transferase/gluconeogenesis factor (CofD/UPF0052 family)
LKIIIFCGGRGSNEIIKSLLRVHDVELSLIVNGYDDGLSTGTIRDLIQGMLGPSDFRKNASNILSCTKITQDLASFFEYRILVSDLIYSSGEISLDKTFFNIFSRFTNSIRIKDYESIKLSLSEFSKFYANLDNKNYLSLIDMAMGNVVIAGTYLNSGNDFNKAISKLNDFMDSSVKIYNVSDGTNFVLVGITSNGKILTRESEIVELKSDLIIQEIFLLDNYLSDSELELINKMSFTEKFVYLKQKQKFPRINPILDSILLSADLIVYGPGTQHSSLYPTYMTQGLAPKLQDLSDTVKVLIGNISEDNDTKSENLKSLIEKMEYYLNLPSNNNFGIDKYLSNIFLSTESNNFTPWGYDKLSLPEQIKISFGQLAKSHKKHDGNRVTNGLFAVYNNHSNTFKIQGYDRVAIVLANLNEQRTLNTVLEKLYYFDWLSYGILPEFILVDGGSIDNSILIAEKFPELRIIELGANLGRGTALKHGILSSNCDFIVTFPTDDEYDPGAVKDVFLALKLNYGSIVFGSRASLSVETNKRLKTIYEKNTYLYYLSKWGGNLITIIAGVKFQRWLSDPLTSVKGFTRSSLNKISLGGNSVNWDTRVVIDASRSLIPIVEIPVVFNPRTRKQGKKITVADGIKALFELLK